MELLLVAFALLVLASPVMSRAVEGGGVDDEKSYYSPPTRRTPCEAPPSHGGGHGAAPSRRPPRAPPQGGGGCYCSPPVTTAPPPPPLVGPVIPSPLVPLVPPTPTLPAIQAQPPLVPLDPNIFPFTCDYWSTHPAVIWGLVGYWGTIGALFGLPAAAAYGTDLSLPAALSNPRADGIGALYREGTASMLNSLTSRSFSFSPEQVKAAFNAAVVSDEAAVAQARVFKKANEGHHKHY
ncbi:uncharacterized protein LOC141835570 [Curcuma longa]|uniref:uncharacterized protein LOC141835570 n=1 Tax=Curcuma longa TaxID=136217 RepID=UPI003D9DFD48